MLVCTRLDVKREGANCFSPPPSLLRRLSAEALNKPAVLYRRAPRHVQKDRGACGPRTSSVELVQVKQSAVAMSYSRVRSVVCGPERLCTVRKE